MSRLTLIYDALTTALPTMLPNHKQMYNPYMPEMNDNLLLRRGYGFFMGPAEHTNRQLDCYYSVRRSCYITLSILNPGTEKDIIIRQGKEKQLLEDMAGLAKAFDRDPALAETSATFRYQSDSGIELLVTPNDNFLMIRSEFSFEYLEEA